MFWQVLRKKLWPSPCYLLRDAVWREEKVRCLALPRMDFPCHGIRRPVVRCPHCGSRLTMVWGQEGLRLLRGQGDCPRCVYWTTIRIAIRPGGIHDVSYPAEAVKRYAYPPPDPVCDEWERV